MRASLLRRVLERLRQGALLDSARRKLLWRMRPRHERFLDGARGVIHIGANTGQERHTYLLCQLPVIWVEPVPETFRVLSENIIGFHGQRAIQCLVTDRDDEEYAFHVANNGGASSSILDLSLHRDIWPNVEFSNTIRLRSSTISSLLSRESIDPSDFDVLVMDTQGSELLVLRGAESILHNFRYIRSEAADFEAYEGGCRLSELSEFLLARGFVEVYRKVFASHPAGGHYYDVLFYGKSLEGRRPA